MHIASETSDCILWLPVGPSLDQIWLHFHAYGGQFKRESKRYAAGFYACLHTFTHTHSIHSYLNLCARRGKHVHFLSLNTIRNTYSTWKLQS